MKNVVVTDASSTTALAMIRSLGKRRIPVIALDSVAYSIGFMSKYCTTHLLYDNPVQYPKKSLATLVRIGEMFKKPILLPAGDDIIFLAMKYRSIIDKAFIFPLPPNSNLKYAVDKELTMQLALREDVPIPKTFIPSTFKQLEELKSELSYPLVIKPRINVGFRSKFGTKIFKVWSFEQLTEAYGLVSKHFPKPLIQEYIPGGTKTLYSVCTIFDAAHRPLGFFSIRKSHQLLEGVTSCGESVETPEIESLSLKILKTIDWVGPAEVEFKLDPRDQEFKLMEINPRPFMWMNLPIESGLDIPYLWYKIAVGETCDEVNKIRKDLKFINLFHYFLGFIRKLSYNKIETEPIWSFLESLKGHFIFDLLSRDDVIPLASYPLLFLFSRVKEAREHERLIPKILYPK